MVTIYPNYGHTLSMVFLYGNTKSRDRLHNQANYGEKNQQLSLFSVYSVFIVLVARSAYISQWLPYTQIMGIR